MAKIKKILWVLFVIMAVIFAIKTYMKLKPQSSTLDKNSIKAETPYSVSDNAIIPRGQEMEKSPDAREHSIQKLISHGWTPEAAKAVFDANEEFFVRIAELDINDLDSELKRLYRLGNPEIQADLAKHPEYATLLCSVMDVSLKAPRNILNTVPTDEDSQKTIAFLYQFNAAPEDAALLASLLQNLKWRGKIVDLIQKAPLQNYQMIKYFQLIQELQNEAPQVASVYEDWLFGILDSYLSVESDSDQAAEFQAILAYFSQPIVREMKRDSGFCANFLECWHKFESILNSLSRSDENYEQIWTAYCQDLSVFRFLYEYRDQQAEELYIKYGAVATDILMSPTFLAPEAKNAREKIIQFLLTMDENSLQAILVAEPQKYPAICKLLDRNLPDNYYLSMFRQLAEANQGKGSNAGNAGKLISSWNGFSEDALKKELGLHDPGPIQFIPGYDIYCLVEKSMQGREVSSGDWAFAGIDAAFIVLDVATLGSSKAVTSTVSTASKGMKVAAKGTKEILKGAAKITAEQAKHNAFVAMRVLKQSNQFLAKQAVKMTHGIDISKLVKFTFEKSGIGNKTFKKWTGMDARIFMRNDRKVLLHLERIPETRAGKLARNVMADMAVGCGLVLALQSDTGQEILSEGKNFVDDPKETTQKWKKNLSMWWRLNQNN